MLSVGEQRTERVTLCGCVGVYEHVWMLRACQRHHCPVLELLASHTQHGIGFEQPDPEAHGTFCPTSLSYSNMSMTCVALWYAATFTHKRIRCGSPIASSAQTQLLSHHPPSNHRLRVPSSVDEMCVLVCLMATYRAPTRVIHKHDL